MLVKHRPIPVRLLGVWDVAGPLGLGVLHLLVRDVQLGLVLERVDPAVAHAVAKLLLLPPQDVVRQIGLDVRLVARVKGFAQDVLFDPACGYHFLLGIHVHADFEELIIRVSDFSPKTWMTCTSLSRNGTRASTPHAEVDLFARKQSER